MIKQIRASLLIALLLGPSLDATAQPQVPALPPEVRTTSAQQAWIQRHVAPQQRGELQAIARSVARDGALTPSSKQRWQGVVTQLVQAGVSIDVNALVQWVIRQSYVGQVGDLQSYADKIEHFNEQKKKLRDERARLRRQQGATPSRPELRRAPPAVATPRPDPPRPDPPRTRDDIDAQIAALDAQLQEVGDDAQLASVDLQNMLQKQQQTLQMLSTISKVLHDTAMAVIRKLGG